MSVFGAGEPPFFHMPFIIKILLLVRRPSTKSDQRESTLSDAKDRHQIPLGSDTLCVLLSAKKWNSEHTTAFEGSAKLCEVSKISIQSGPSNAHNRLHDHDRDIHQFVLFCVFSMFEMPTQGVGA